ncbi:MAG TPA: hypothetical protein PKD67_05745 [Ignavibacteriaceae bacterium]|nr:hypothetical protein [Ignavibacteriaceae bacterium]
MKHKILVIFSSFIFALLVWGSITLSDQFYSSYDFHIKVVNNPTGYVCGITNPEFVAIKLKAKGWQLLNFNLNPPSDFLVSAHNDSGLIKVDAYDQIAENPWLSSGITIIDILPRSLSLFVEKMEFKKVKVEANADLKFQKGFGLATPIKIYPDSIIVAGPKSIIAKTTSIKTNLVSYASLDNPTSVITELGNLPGFQYQQKNVHLTLDVQRIVDNVFEGIKVAVKNIPPDRDVVLIPNIINCSLRGGINIIGKISNDQINAWIDYRDIVLDTLGSLKPKLTIPPNTQLLFTKPEELRYIIKKFE